MTKMADIYPELFSALESVRLTLPLGMAPRINENILMLFKPIVLFVEKLCHIRRLENINSGEMNYVLVMHIDWGFTLNFRELNIFAVSREVWNSLTDGAVLYEKESIHKDGPNRVNWNNINEFASAVQNGLFYHKASAKVTEEEAGNTVVDDRRRWKVVFDAYGPYEPWEEAMKDIRAWCNRRQIQMDKRQQKLTPVVSDTTTSAENEVLGASGRAAGT